MNINKNIKMKSTLSALAVVIMACGIMSCNKQPQANDTKETPKTAATTATAGSQQILERSHKNTRSKREEYTENSCRKATSFATSCG